MENIISVLDHGYVKLLNISGPTRRVKNNFDADDVDPAQAARMSYDNAGEGRTREADIKLAEYLWKHKHTTPFEMIVVWLEMKLPIFVARQIIRHRTSSVNEVSARYVALSNEWYLPELHNIKTAPTNNKQGRSDEVYPDAIMFLAELNKQCRASYEAYKYHIERGLAPELARLFLHINHYTKWIWKQDLHNLFHLLGLRDGTNELSHPMFETQEYARAIKKLIRKQLPKLVRIYEES